MEKKVKARISNSLIKTLLPAEKDHDFRENFMQRAMIDELEVKEGKENDS